MEKERIYKDFDLPTKHLESVTHFVPAKAREEDEIERRRRQPRGLLLASHQERGLAVASSILKHLGHDEEAIRFSSRLIAASGLNTAWYGFARNAESEVMRRRLKLPMLAVDSPEFRQSSEDILYDSGYYFSEARIEAGKLTIAIANQSPKVEQQKRTLGRVVGRASLTLACVELGDKLLEHPLRKVDTQNLVRQSCLTAINDAKTLGTVLGLPPSIAQFADPDSHLSVYWRRESPNSALEAYEQAIELQLTS